MLNIIDANLSYKKQKLFTHLNLSVPEGEWVAILGRSGVGKTTLLRMIAGLAQKFPEPDTLITGSIKWQGKPDLHTEVTYMAQQDGLMPWLSIIDNIVMPQRIKGSFIDIARAKNLLKQVGLAAHLDKKPGQLSGGMRQRVALARTLFQDKPIILMDEPFSALDALTRIDMQNLFIKNLRPQKKLLLMVTHDPWEALRLADQIWILKGEPAEFTYSLHLPKSEVLRAITPKLLEYYNEILAALGE